MRAPFQNLFSMLSLWDERFISSSSTRYIVSPFILSSIYYLMYVLSSICLIIHLVSIRSIATNRLALSFCIFVCGIILVSLYYLKTLILRMPSIFTTNRESSISIMPFSGDLSSWMKHVLKAHRSKKKVLKALVPQEKRKKKNW